MKEYTRFIGLDVHKASITVAYAEAGRSEPVDYGDIPNTPEAIAKMVKKLAREQESHFSYEAGACGYEIYRQLTAMGYDCLVAAPSLIPKQPGCHIKTNRRDARSLSKLDRAGELTAVWVPDEAQEAIRDLVRCRKDFKEQQHQVRQRLSSFFLRHGRHFKEGKAWTDRHARWMATQKFAFPEQEIVFREYLHQLEYSSQRLVEMERQMAKSLEGWNLRPVVEALMALKGEALVVAMTLVSELGDISRFATPQQFMAFVGLVPSEYSSAKRRQGGITKTGNGAARMALIEAAWCYRTPARMTRHLKAKAAQAPPAIQEIAWTAQKRLHDRYWHLVHRGKKPVQAVAAVARELAGFVWAIASTVMDKPPKTRRRRNDIHPGHKGPTPKAEAAPERTRPPTPSRGRQRVREFLQSGVSPTGEVRDDVKA